MGFGRAAWADDKASLTLGAVFSKHQVVTAQGDDNDEVRKANRVSRSYPWAVRTLWCCLVRPLVLSYVECTHSGCSRFKYIGTGPELDGISTTFEVMSASTSSEEKIAQ
eukprot:2755628-Amphidinium_carterae.1